MSSIDNRKGVIYMYTFPSGKQYIGQTWDEERRKKDHQKTRSGCSCFYLAIKKYGYENFKYEVLYKDIQTQEEMDSLEQQEIRIHNTLSPNGYNLVSGGSNGKRSEETRKTMSDARMGMQFTDEHRANLRKAKEYVSPETRQKMREKKLGRKLPVEQRTKIAKSNTGKKMSLEAVHKSSEARKGGKRSLETKEKLRIVHIGKVCSEETRTKMSESQKGKKMPPSHAWNTHLAQQKYIKCVELNLIFDGVSTATKVLRGSASSMKQAASGRIHTSGGYHWEYMD